MDHDGGRSPICPDLWIEQSDSVAQFRILQRIHEPAEARTHGLPFEPRTRGSGRNDHHFELRIFAHAPGQTFGEAGGGKILILDEDCAFGTFDGIEE